MSKKAGQSPDDRDSRKMFDVITELWESTYGHGWKRRLAELADVPESTVHSWLKARRLPPWLERIFRLLAENNRLKRDIAAFKNHVNDCATADQVVKTDRGYAVYRFAGGIGELVCDNIPSEDTAVEIASLPRLKDIADRVRRPLIAISDSVDLFHGDEVSEAEELLLELDDWARPAVLKDKTATMSEEDLVTALGEVVKMAQK